MKSLMSRRSLGIALAVALSLGSLSPSFAAGCDPYAALVSAVSFTTVITDVVAVAALVVAVLVAIRAVRFIFAIVRR